MFQPTRHVKTASYFLIPKYTYLFIKSLESCTDRNHNISLAGNTISLLFSMEMNVCV